MKNVKLRHTDSPLTGRIRTIDAAPFCDPIARTMLGITNSFGALSPEDVEAIKNILHRYGGSGSTPTTQTGISSGDSARARDQRNRRAQTDAQTAHTRSVAEGYRKFWDAANAQRAASITR